MALVMVASLLPVPAMAEVTEDITTAEKNGNTDVAMSAASVTLTLRLPDGLYADGDEATRLVTRTAGADGAIDPIVISCEDEGAFSAELAEAINKNSSVYANGLYAKYNADNDTLTLSGTLDANAELDMEEILIAASGYGVTVNDNGGTFTLWNGSIAARCGVYNDSTFTNHRRHRQRPF